MSDKEKLLIGIIIVMIGAFFSYRIEMVDRALIKHTNQIEALRLECKLNKVKQ
jgi:hypothetical protein